MTDQIFFAQKEANCQIGLEVESLANFPAVPKGTRGKVIKARHHAADNYVVEVRWMLPQPGAFYHLMVGDVCLNLFRKRRPITDEFNKYEFQDLVTVV